MGRVTALLVTALLATAAPAPGQEGDGLSLTGHLRTVDGGSPAGLRVLVWARERLDSTEVDSSGRFALRIPSPPHGAHLEVRIDGPDPSARRYLPVSLALRPADAEREQRLVLIPRQWALRYGRHAGTTVDIHPELAFEPVCRGCSSFYRPAVTTTFEEGTPDMQTWPASAFPLRVAFDRALSRGSITPHDSARVWAGLREVEGDFGRDLFRPAPFHETLRAEHDAPEDVVLLSFEPIRHGHGWGSTVAQSGDIFFGGARFRSQSALSGADGRSLVTHELLHVLGHGHTCSWRSVMADTDRCPAQRSNGATAHDVAYAELLWTVRETERRFDASGSMEAALAGAGVPEHPLDSPGAGRALSRKFK